MINLSYLTPTSLSQPLEEIFSPPFIEFKFSDSMHLAHYLASSTPSLYIDEITFPLTKSYLSPKGSSLPTFNCHHDLFKFVTTYNCRTIFLFSLVLSINLTFLFGRSLPPSPSNLLLVLSLLMSNSHRALPLTILAIFAYLTTILIVNKSSCNLLDSH